MVAATQVTAVADTAETVAAVVLIAVHRVSLMVTALRVHRTVTRPALKRIYAPKRHHALTSRQARTAVAQSNRHVHPMVATTAATTMIAHRAPVVTPVTVATLAAVKIVVQRLLIVVVRIHASVLHVLMQLRARTKVVKSVVPLAVTVRTLALPLVMVIAMIAQRALSAIAIHVRSLIVHRVPTRIAVIVSNVRLAHPRRAANTHHVHAPSARSHSSAQSVRNTRRVQRVRSSTKLARRVTWNAQRALLQRHLPTVAIALHVARPSRLSMLRQ